MDDVQLCELLSSGACPITISITVRYILGILCIQHFTDPFVRSFSLQLKIDHIDFIFAGITNNLLQVEVLESGSNVMIQCRLLAAITELVHCEARYGTDPSHHVLPYRDTSNSAGLEGDVLTIHISHDLQSHTTYYYNISLVAVDGIISARVLHSIRIGKENSTCVDSLQKNQLRKNTTK